jgi:hypothetical protein
VRTVIAPLHPEVAAQVHALDRRRAEIARRYIRRLGLEPNLGAPTARGLLVEHGCRRIYFDRDDRPDDLFRARRPPARRGDEDLSEGPVWRIVYWTGEAQRTQTRLVVILAVGRGHARPPDPDAYELATRRLRALLRVPEGKESDMNAYLVTAAAYHRTMSDDGLPHPAESLTLSEVRDQQTRVIEMLEQGGAIILYTDDQQHLFGVLTRDRTLLDEASIAAMIDTGHLPPMAELLAMDDRGELP